MNLNGILDLFSICFRVVRVIKAVNTITTFDTKGYSILRKI